MNRVFCVMSVALGVAALAANGQTARADLLKQDSSASTWWKYEMNSAPESQNLDTYAGVDFSLAAGSADLLGGISSLSTNATYVSNGATNSGAVWQNISYANGYTIEVRLKSKQASEMNASMAILACPETTKCGYLFVGDTGQYWGELNGTPSGVSLGSDDNSSSFHVFRIAQLPNQDSYSVWRDGKLLSSSLTSGHTDTDVAPLLYVGQGVSGEAVGGATKIDYIRITSGAYAPVPEPSAMILLISALIGLLAYAWRKRK